MDENPKVQAVLPVLPLGRGAIPAPPGTGAPSTAEGTERQLWKGNSAEESTARANHQNFTAGYGTSVSEEHFSDKIKHFLSRSEQRNVFCNEFVIFCTVRFDNLQYFVM